MKWTDTRDIAIALAETHPDANPRSVLFTDLSRWVLELPGFDDDPKHSGEKILAGHIASGFNKQQLRGMIVELDNFASELMSAFEHRYVDHGERSRRL